MALPLRLCNFKQSCGEYVELLFQNEIISIETRKSQRKDYLSTEERPGLRDHTINMVKDAFLRSTFGLFLSSFDSAMSELLI